MGQYMTGQYMIRMLSYFTKNIFLSKTSKDTFNGFTIWETLCLIGIMAGLACFGFSRAFMRDMSSQHQAEIWATHLSDFMQYAEWKSLTLNQSLVILPTHPPYWTEGLKLVDKTQGLSKHEKLTPLAYFDETPQRFTLTYQGFPNRQEILLSPTDLGLNSNGHFMLTDLRTGARYQLTFNKAWRMQLQQLVN
jgi:hypothetical protein